MMTENQSYFKTVDYFVKKNIQNSVKVRRQKIFLKTPTSVIYKQLFSFSFKGIVSRDWGRLKMGSLDRSEFRMIPLEVYF
jgi:hypothetical protein